jgi:serine/threonine protein kinase
MKFNPENPSSLEQQKPLKPKTGLEGFYTPEFQRTLKKNPKSFVSVLQDDPAAFKTIADIIWEDRAREIQAQQPQNHEKNPDTYSEDPTTAQIQKALYDNLGINVNTDSNGFLKKLIKGCIDGLIIWNVELIQQIKEKGLWTFLSQVVSQFTTTDWWKQLFAKIWDDVGNIFSLDPYKTWKTGSEYIWMIWWAGLAGWALKKWWKALAETGAKVAIKAEWKTLASSALENTGKWMVKTGEAFQVPYKAVEKVTGATLKVWAEVLGKVPWVNKVINTVKSNAARIITGEGIKMVASRDTPASLRKQIGAIGDISKVKPFDKWEWKPIMEDMRNGMEEPKPSEPKGEKKELGFDITKNEIYSQWQYSHLKDYAEFLWELKEWDILGHWVNAMVVRHPTREWYVVKIPKKWWDDVVAETMKHNKAYIALRQWKKEWIIPDTIEIPEIQIWTENQKNYFLIKKVDWQSLHTKFLREHPDLQVVFKDIPKEKLDKMTDEQIWRTAMDYGKGAEYWVDKMYNLIDFESGAFTKEFLQKNYPEYQKMLQYFKDKGIEHNDLHWWNFMVWNDGKLYLIDFGKASIK